MWLSAYNVLGRSAHNRAAPYNILILIEWVYRGGEYRERSCGIKIVTDGGQPPIQNYTF